MCGDEDLHAHRVKLAACCDAFENCEDVILHVALHSTADKPTVEQECELHDNLSNAIRKKRGVFKKWDQRHAVFRKSHYATAAAVATGLKRGDVVNDPVVLDLISHQCLAHITLYGRHTMWSITLGNADFVPIKLAHMSNGVLHPVKNCDTIGVMPAKNVPCCTVASGTAECQQSQVSEMEAKHVVCGLLDDVIDRVVSEKEVMHGVVSGLLDEVLQAVVSQSETQVQIAECVLRSASKKVIIDVHVPRVCDVEKRDESSKRVLRARKKMGTSQSPGSRGSSVADTVTPAKKKKMGTSQSLVSQGDSVADTVMPAKTMGGSLIDDLMSAFRENFPDVQESQGIADVDQSFTQLHFSSVESVRKVPQGQRVLRKRSAKPVVVACQSDKDDDVPLSQLCSSSTQPARVLRKHSAKPVVVASHIDEDDDVPLSQLHSSSTQPAHVLRKRSAKPVVVASRSDEDECSDSDDELPLSRFVKRKCSWKHTKRRSFTCAMCSAHFRSHGTLKGHLLKKHKHYPCRTMYCYEHFVTISNRDAHEAVHTIQKYVCSVCKCVFKHKSVRD